jgi:hypothetical protein
MPFDPIHAVEPVLPGRIAPVVLERAERERERERREKAREELEERRRREAAATPRDAAPESFAERDERPHIDVRG